MNLSIPWILRVLVTMACLGLAYGTYCAWRTALAPQSGKDPVSPNLIRGRIGRQRQQLILRLAIPFTAFLALSILLVVIAFAKPFGLSP